MKRMMAVLLLVTVLVAVMPATALAASKTQIYHVATRTDPLIVHSQPNDLKSTRIGRLPRNSALTILSKSGKWFRIKSAKGLVGWVFGSYVAKYADARVVTQTDPLVIRKRASASSAKLGIAPKGSTVRVQYITGNWACIVSPIKGGFCSRTYLSWIA